MVELGNVWWMYLLGIIVTVFVIGGCIFFILKAFREAKRLNMDKEVLKKTVISSALFTVLPSISILVGIFALAGQLGIPLPWIRLSVIGALHYETIAASEALKNIPADALDTTKLVTVASVMTIGILSGPLFCLFGFKAYDKKLLSKAKAQSNTEGKTDEVPAVKEEPKPKKKGFGDVLFSAVFIAMIGSYVIWDSIKPFIKMDDLTNGSDKAKENALSFFTKQPYLQDKLYIPLVVVLVSFGCMALCEFLEKKCKQKWLSNFSLGFSMIVGMAVAAVLAAI